MATLNIIPETKQSPSAMRGLINYCLQEKKTFDINSERKILLSEFDQNNNWCLAEEYRDGKFYAKCKRVFEYIE